MDTEVASSEMVPRFVDLALFLCGTALRNLRGELQSTDPVAVGLHRWYLHKVCFLHALPNDDYNSDNAVGSSGEEGVAGNENAAQWFDELESCKEPPGRSFPPPPPTPTSFATGVSKEVNFRSAFSQLHHPVFTAVERQEKERTDELGNTPDSGDANTIGRVHARSASESLEGHSASFEDASNSVCRPTDVGFNLLEAFLNVAQKSGGAAWMQRVAAALVDTLTEETALPGMVSPSEHRAAVAAAAASSRSPLSSRPSPVVHVATLSKLFNDDLLDDELSMEAGNATRSFHVWVNYEWASASFLRQTRLAAVATRWLRELCRYRDGRQQQQQLSAGEVSLSLPVDTPPQQPFTPGKSVLSLLPTNIREMYTALEGVFEGHTNTRRLLMEAALLQRAPHVTDNALAKLLFLQGPSIASNVSRGDLTNRGTQPILTSITSGMLLYAQYYLSFRSLHVARQCVRVALQVAQEVHSNTILALSHYTAHVVAVHQGRPADAANSISIALQLSLGNNTHENANCNGGVGMEGVSGAGIVDGQMASVAFAGAAQLLLFFPGAVSAALRSVLSTGRLCTGGSGGYIEGTTERDVNPNALSNTHVSADDRGRQSMHSGGGAVSVQTIAQSIRHAVLRAETSLLHSPPVEGRWIGVIASLHRETLLLIGAVYGIVSTPTIINEASLRGLVDQVKREAALTSPLFSAQCRRNLFWEVLRHTAHRALSLQENLFLTDTRSASNTGSSEALRCLRTALQAMRAHYGESAIQAATKNVFFACVVRYCAACRLQNSGYATAAYSLFTTVVKCLSHAAGMEGETNTATAGSGNNSSSSSYPFGLSDVEAAAQACWPPDHLLLYALAQDRRAKTATFLGLVSVPTEAQQALLAVSSCYSFSYGVLTSQLMEARIHQHNGRYNAALAIARRVELSALRIGYPSIAEAACTVQVTAYSSSNDWRAAQRVLLRLQPRHGGHRVFLLLYKFSVHLELLLSEKEGVSSRDVVALARNWLKLMCTEKLLLQSPTSPGVTMSVDTEMSLAERLCVLSTVTRACSLLNRDGRVLGADTLTCLRNLQQRQGVPTPDIYVHGNCEEVCLHNFA